MVQIVDFDLKQAVLVNGPFGPAEVRQIQAAVAHDHANYQLLRDAVNELQAKEEQTPASMVRLGVGLFLLGRYFRAIEVLRQGDGGALAHFYLAKSYFARQQFDLALEAMQAAERAGYDAGECALGRAEALRYDGQADRVAGHSRQPLRRHRADGRIPLPNALPRWPSSAGIPVRSSPCTSVRSKSITATPALFGLALENDRRGNDDTAMELYKRAASDFPPFLGPLMNLGLMYEDRQQYDRAAQCYQRVLDVYPDHFRAALFFKDTEASHEQFYDEDAQRSATAWARSSASP